MVFQFRPHVILSVKIILFQMIRINPPHRMLMYAPNTAPDRKFQINFVENSEKKNNSKWKWKPLDGRSDDDTQTEIKCFNEILRRPVTVLRCSEFCLCERGVNFQRMLLWWCICVMCVMHRVPFLFHLFMASAMRITHTNTFTVRTHLFRFGLFSFTFCSFHPSVCSKESN